MINTRKIANEYRLTHWAQIIQERVKKELSIKDFCLQEGICQNTYYYWQRRVRAAACEELAQRRPKVNLPGFTEVLIAEAPALPPVTPKGQLCIEISGCKITADSSYPIESLTALLRALKC